MRPRSTPEDRRLAGGTPRPRPPVDPPCTGPGSTPRKAAARAFRSLAAAAAIAIAFSLAVPGATVAAEPAAAPAPPPTVVVTNYVVVTNVVVITNYVTVLLTNSVGTAPAPVPPVETVTEAGSRRGKGPPRSLPDLSWVPPEDGHDWIQLKSGEWLRGRIKAMQHSQLDFDSEKLEDLEFDWEDIRQVRSARILDALYEDGTRLTGQVRATPQEVAVGGDDAQALPRSRLQSLTPGGPREWDAWSGKGSFGLTMRAGNTEQTEFNAQARLQRRTAGTRLTLDYLGNAATIDGDENANNHRATAEFDYWLSRRFYLIVPFAEYFRDPFQNLAHRLTAGAGVGYDLYDRPKLEWNITAGPGFQQAWFDSVEPGESDRKSVAAILFGTRLEWEITRRLDLTLEYRGQFTSREVGETTHHTVGTFSFDLTRRFDLDVSFIWDRIAYPKPASDGVQPKPDDYRLVVGLGIEF